MDNTCSVESCENPHYGRGWCQKHYRRWRLYGDPLAGGTFATPRADQCSIEGCTEPVLARTWCVNHYGRWQRNGDPLGGRPSPGTTQRDSTCSVEGCSGTAATSGMCGSHYYRWHRYGDPLVRDHRRKAERVECAVNGCSEERASRGWCHKHYQRWKQYGDPEAPLRRARNGESTKRWLNHDGYVLIRLLGKNVLEHRQVMEEMLGRPMLREETVHHKNGKRGDNRRENLELWVSTRSGQRASDLAAFVVEHYRAEVLRALSPVLDDADGNERTQAHADRLDG